MEDNKSSNTYMYEILVETGPMSNHATTSKIQFILTGEKGNTGVRTFNQPSKALFTKKQKNKFTPFKKGARDSFLMTTNKSLGKLNYLRIWTDSSGLGEMSAWYPMSIKISDIQTDQSTDFIIDQWLAIDRGTFEDDINIPSYKSGEELSRSYLFKSALNHNFTDDHLWWSVFSRPVRSRFNRKQRITVCMVMLMLTILVCGIYYHITSGTLIDALWSLGPLGLDARDVRHFELFQKIL